MNFLRQPATRRDLLWASGVLAALIVIAILGAVRTAIKLNERYDVVVTDKQVVLERVDEQEATIAGQEETIAGQDEQLGDAERELESVTARLEVVSRRVREVVAAPAEAPERGALSDSGNPVPRPVVVDRVVGRVVDRPAPERPVFSPPSLPERPGRALPERPPRPQRPERPPILPRPPAPPAPTPVPPVVTPVPPVAVVPPRPGNKPEHAPCPPSNKHCG
jgi:uncharacterized coiled-coil protein SlyX